MRSLTSFAILCSALILPCVSSFNVSDIKCTNVDVGGGYTTLVCYYSSGEAVTGKSRFENGTEISTGTNTALTYNVWKVDDVMDPTTKQMKDPEIGTEIVMSVTRSDTTCTGVTVDSNPCLSCSYCGGTDERFSADCSNIVNGRTVTCESAWPIYFPLTAAALTVVQTPPTSTPSTVPSALPTATPTTLPSTVPSTIPSTSPSASPSEAPVSPNGITCSDTAAADEGGAFEVCYKSSMAAISGTSFSKNSTQGSASQVYWYNYTIYPKDSDEELFLITMSRSGEVLDGGNGQDLTTCDYVVIDDEVCNSCNYCGNETFAADCNNVPMGRKTSCESVSDLFFPLTRQAVLPKTDSPSTLPSSIPSSTPSDVPSASPSDIPSSAPSDIPSSSPSDIPSSSPSDIPSSSPSDVPSSGPTAVPSSGPSAVPSSTPSVTPSSVPSAAPTSTPSTEPSSAPAVVIKAEASAACSAYQVCADLGLVGNCCPTVDNILLDCCYSVEPVPASTSEKETSSSPTKVPSTSTPVASPTKAPTTSAPVSKSTVVPVTTAVTNTTTSTVIVRPCQTFNMPLYTIVGRLATSNFDVCVANTSSHHGFFGQFDNGTQTPVYEHHSYKSTIYYFDNKELSKPIVVTMQRSGDVDNTTASGVDIDLTQCDYLAINGVNCTSCTYCGNEMYKADCTNMEYGRVSTTCESNSPVLFPFIASVFTLY
jgi:hypothetical protein